MTRAAVPAVAFVLEAVSLRIAGMFMDGIAGIENTAVTVPPVNGEPSDFVTVT